MAQRKRSRGRKTTRRRASSGGTNWLLWGAIALGLYLLLKPKTAAAAIAPASTEAMGPPQQVTVNLPGGESMTAMEPVDGFGTYFYVR